MKRHDIKVFVRYIIIAFFMYLAWDITRPEYLVNVKDLGDVASSAIYASVFGVLGWVVKSNWGTSPIKE